VRRRKTQRGFADLNATENAHEGAQPKEAERSR